METNTESTLEVSRVVWGWVVVTDDGSVRRAVTETFRTEAEAVARLAELREAGR
jgi:hypothetical protein